MRIPARTPRPNDPDYWKEEILIDANRFGRDVVSTDGCYKEPTLVAKRFKNMLERITSKEHVKTLYVRTVSG